MKHHPYRRCIVIGLLVVTLGTWLTWYIREAPGRRSHAKDVTQLTLIGKRIADAVRNSPQQVPETLDSFVSMGVITDRDLRLLRKYSCVYFPPHPQVDSKVVLLRCRITPTVYLVMDRSGSTSLE